MKANELRIGNLILENGKITEVENIINDKINYQNYHRVDPIQEPIPLSEEILLKCGFQRKPFTSGLTYDRFRFTWEPVYEYWYVVDKYSNSYLSKIEFVHELQNFLFVMNNQELNTSGLI